MLQDTPNCTKAGPCQKTATAVCLDKQVAATTSGSLAMVLDSVMESAVVTGGQSSATLSADHFFSVDTSRPVDSAEMFKAPLLVKLLVSLLVIVHTATKIPGITVNQSESRFVIGHESVDFLYLGLAHDHKRGTISHT